jgi:hypothetical protein
MVFRAHFFLEYWRRFLALAGYSEARHFISREAADITEILINGLIGLIFIYRDHTGSKVFPLLPWLHSSETCEHAFAECRKLVKDFTHLDFIQMVPRLSVSLRKAVREGKTSNPKACAAGYAHTYFDYTDVNMATLAQFPTDGEIAVAARDAHNEAESLLYLLGITLSDLQPLRASEVSLRLPSINSWYASNSIQGATRSQATPPNEELTDDEDCDTEESEAQMLEELLNAQAIAALRTVAADEAMLSLTRAAFAIHIDEHLSLYVLPHTCSLVEKSHSLLSEPQITRTAVLTGTTLRRLLRVMSR